MRLRMNADRENTIERLKRATGENTKSGAIDVAMKHYLSDLENKRNLYDELTGEQIDALSTAFLPMERISSDSAVGRGEE